MIHENIELTGSFNISGSFVLPNHVNTASLVEETGSMYHDQVDGVLKIYTGTQWVVVGDQTGSAAGGGGGTNLEYLVVAGGAGSGNNNNGYYGGGGGAGGFLSSSISSITSGSTITVTIGAGSSGGNPSSNGTNSSIASTAGTSFTTVTSLGGGGAHYVSNDGLDGGSGGGGSGNDFAQAGGSGTLGQGYAGGTHGAPPGGGAGAGSGGGGAGGVGQVRPSAYEGGDGGAPLGSKITGTTVYYAGGGGAGRGYHSPYSKGSYHADFSGGVNSGGGGSHHISDNDSGDSGVVILAYPTGSITATGGEKTSRSDGQFVHTFKTSGTLTVGGPTFQTVAPADHFKVVTYTGNGGAQSITGVGFNPDFVWVKNRNTAGNPHEMADIVRGVNNTINSNSSNTQYNNSSYQFNSFNADGFTVTDDSAGNYGVNGNGETYVAWSWKAGGSLNTFNINGTGYASATAAGLDGGSLTPTGASVNTPAGFSIINVTSGGSTADVTVSHGLGVKPSFVMFKKLNSEGGGWFTWHKDLPSESNYLYLNDNYAISNLTQSTNAWGNRSFDANLVSFRQGWTVETNRDVILYCFADIANYQKTGVYTGTGGAFTVTVGFQPRFVMIKRTDNTGSWVMLDEPRGSGDNRLYADSNSEEHAGQGESLTSTGFSPRNTTTNDTNTSGGTYIYLAIA